MFRALLISLVILMSCENAGFEADPDDTANVNFEIFWQEFDKHYSFFELKNIDWTEVYHTYNGKVDDFNLFGVLEKIVLDLKDGHVNLYTDQKTVSYDFTNGHRSNEPTFAIRYIESTKTPNNSVSYSKIKNSNLGYIRIFSFEGETANFELIDDIISEFRDLDGIIIDVRSNNGGDDRNAKIIASRFADQKRAFRKFKYRNGPNHSDFTDWQEDFISPGGSGSSFTKPVAILTNKSSFSATESFILAMQAMPHASTVGDVTGGGNGNPIIRELPNGWYFRLPHWIVSTSDDFIFEGIGLEPDHLIQITSEDMTILKDAILEKAIELLE